MPAAMPPGFALVNADVWTMKTPKERAQAVVVADGTIEFVGREDRAIRHARSLGLRVFDVEGARVIPGLIDAHTHLVHIGILSRRVDLADAPSRTAVLRRVAQAVNAARHGELVLAERFDESHWKDKAWPTKDELDRISLEHPIIVRRVDGHIAVANRLAVEQVARVLHGVDKGNGLLVEEAALDLHRVYPTPVPHAVDAASIGQELAFFNGITAVHDFVHMNYLRGWQNLNRRGKLLLRVTATPYLDVLDQMAAVGLETGFGDGQLRLGGVKLFADGTIGAHTAALTKEYGDEKGSLGRLNFTDDELMGHMDRAQDANLQVSVHAIGDGAIEQTLTRMQDLPKRDRTKLRHRIEHFEMGTKDQWRKTVDLGVVLSMQPNFVGEWGSVGGMYQQRFGDARYKETNLFRQMWDDGVPIAFGSDCMPLDPWFGLESVVNAPWPAQRLKIEEALQCYTRNSAFSIHRDHELGTLEKGKAADLAIVQGDWKKKGGIAATKVLATVSDGVWVHQAGPLTRRADGPAS
jgi:hypothetical protein